MRPEDSLRFTDRLEEMTGKGGEVIFTRLVGDHGIYVAVVEFARGGVFNGGAVFAGQGDNIARALAETYEKWQDGVDIARRAGKIRDETPTTQ